MKSLLLLLSLLVVAAHAFAEEITLSKVPSQWLPAADESRYFNVQVTTAPKQMQDGKYICWVQSGQGKKYPALLRPDIASSVKVGDMLHVWLSIWFDDQAIRSPNPDGSWHYAFSRRGLLYADGSSPDGPASKAVPVVKYVTEWHK